MDILNRWMYKLSGRKVPVFRVVDVGANGLIKSISLKKWVDRPNSLIESWEVIGASKSDNGEGLVTYTDESGLTQPAYAEYKGRTCNIYVRPRAAPNHEKTTGAAATIDDVAEALDMGKSMRNMLIGFIVGCIAYAGLIGPMLAAVMS